GTFSRLSSRATQSFSFLLLRPPRSSTLFPYTTLFRSKPIPSRLQMPSRMLALPHRPAREGTHDHHDRHRAARHSRHDRRPPGVPDRKSTRLNSSHLVMSYAVFCLKQKQPRLPYRRDLL